jgi:sugar transferase (PEP-CTERM/EpsH1 system associated)
VNVLFLTHRVPYPPNSGDRVRAFHIARLLATRVTVDVVSLAHDERELAHADAMADLLHISVTGVRTTPVRNYAHAGLALLGSRPLTHCLLDTPRMLETLQQAVRRRRPDVVLAYCSGMARFAFSEPLRQFPLVLDFVDVDSRKWSALADTSVAPRRWIYAREAKSLGAFEAMAARRAVTNLVVNDRERDALAALAPDATIHVVNNGVDFDGLHPRTAPSPSQKVDFCGVMSYAPNIEAATWVASEVWPLVRSSCPDARLVIVGSNPAHSVRTLSSQEAGIEVTGAVEDVRPYLWDAAISVAPLRTARGLQNKVLEALAAQLPVVTTPQVFEGLPPQVHAGCEVASEPQQFAEAIVRLLAMTPCERRTMAARASVAQLGWETRLDPLLAILEHAMREGPPVRTP